MSFSSLIKDYVGSGLLVDRPVTPNVAPGVGATYYATDVSTLFIWDGTAWAAAGGSSGTVTSVGTGTGLTGGPITTSGTIDLANTPVTPGSYTNANITVDAQGRLTSASNGSGGASWTVVHNAPVPNPSTQVDVTGLGSYSEIICLIDAVPTSATTFRTLRLSIDNGATFFSGTSEYSNLQASGAKGGATGFTFHSASSTSPLSGIIHIPNLNMTGIRKLALAQFGYVGGILEATTSPVNAVRLCLSGAGNMTGGTFTILAR